MQEKLKVTKMIHLAMISGVSLAYFIIGNLQSLDFLKLSNVDISNYIFLLIPAIAIFLGAVLYKKQLQNVEDNLSLEKKVGHYQTALLVRWALLEGAAFIILFVKPELIIIGVFLILYMAFLRPSEEGMKSDFKSIGK